MHTPGKKQTPGLDPKLAERIVAEVKEEEIVAMSCDVINIPSPTGEELEMSSFMLIEYPVGCWYCEMPEVTGIVLVELPAGKSATFTRSQVKITGKLSLNATDPENFLYTLQDAKVSGAD